MKVKSESEVTQSCPTLSNPMDCSPSGSSVHGIFQARVLEWDAVAFSGKHTLPYVKQIACGHLLYDSGSFSWYTVTTWRAGMGWKMGGRFRREGYMYTCD